jgi:hypothetical protein
VCDSRDPAPGEGRLDRLAFSHPLVAGGPCSEVLQPLAYQQLLQSIQGSSNSRAVKFVSLITYVIPSTISYVNSLSSSQLNILFLLSSDDTRASLIVYCFVYSLVYIFHVLSKYLFENTVAIVYIHFHDPIFLIPTHASPRSSPFRSHHYLAVGSRWANANAHICRKT